MEFLHTAWSIALIILGFGLLIAVHELGHFLAARWAGIRVDGFAVGMGPVALAWRQGVGLRTRGTDAEIMRRHGKRAIDLTDAELVEHGIGETEYSLRWLPIGGFVKMVGQEDLKPTQASVTSRSYGRCPVGKRMVVVSAGVIANVILALVLFVIAFMVGVRVEAPVIGFVVPDRPAASATLATDGVTDGDGLRPGDRVVRVDGKNVRSFADMLIASAMSKPGDELLITVQRNGHERALDFLVAPARDEHSGLRTIGVVPAASNRLSADRDAEPYVEALLARTGLGDAGVRPGMELVEVDGHAVRTWEQAEAHFRAGEPSETVWQAEDGTRVAAPLTPSAMGTVRVVGAAGGAAAGDDSVVETAWGVLGLVPLTMIMEVMPESANRGLLEPGDVILQVAGDVGPRDFAVRERVSSTPNTTVPILVRRGVGGGVGGGVDRGGDVVEVRARVNRRGQIGVRLGPAESTLEIAAVPERIIGAGSTRSTDATGGRATANPFAVAGLTARTRIVSVDGVEVHDWIELRRALLSATVSAHAAGGDATIELGIVPLGDDDDHDDGAGATTVAVHLAGDEIGALHAMAWRSGIDSIVFDPMATILTAGGNPFRAVAMGFRETHQLIMLTYLTIDRLFRRSVGVDQLRGPVGIVHLGTRVVDRGFMHMLFFLGMISVNLAVLNFLPLPIVDGGLFLFLIYEKIRGEPPPVAFQNVATLIGLLLIGTLFVVTFYNDIARLITGSV